jgi:hypothetical protein
MVRSLAEKLEAMPGVAHLERLVNLEATLKQMNIALDKVVCAVLNGEASLVTTMHLLKARVDQLEEWKTRRLEEEQRQREILETTRARGRWQLIAAIIAPVLAAVLTWLFTR